MRPYVLSSGLIFCLILVAHGLRVYVEGPRLLGEPFFVATTLIAVALTVWAGRLLTRKGGG